MWLRSGRSHSTNLKHGRIAERLILFESNERKMMMAMEKNYYHHKKHREWREKVLRRDKYLCQECKKFGKKVSATHAHHIKPVEEYPELRYVVENGESLCLKCHNKRHPEKGGNWK